jgi:arylsulfatase
MGQHPFRTGMLTIGMPGSKQGIQAGDITIAEALKPLGYMTAQIGKNHLGDRNEFLPTVHGFDEFYGNLYHLNSEEEPEDPDYPKDPEFHKKFGPRGVLKTWATDKDDATEDPRWGRVGKQKIVDEGPLPPYPDMSNVPNMQEGLQKAKYDMTTFDEVLVKASSDFMDKAKRDGKPFFVWHNTTRMHVWTFLSPKYKAMQNSQTNYGLEEAGMAQLDDSVGALLKKIDDIGETNNTIVIFTTDNGAEVFTWPDGGMTPFKNTKGTVGEGGFRVPAIIRWPGQIKPGTVENGIFSGLDWLPTLAAAAGNPNIKDQLLKGVQLGDRTYKNHLDGYNQMDLLTGNGPSNRHELFYFGGANLGAVRLDDFKFTFYQQPYGWPGEKTTTDMPGMANIRQDPFERTPNIRGESPNTGAWGYGNDFFAREFWRFVMVQQYVAKLAETAINYPPMQDPASFNLEAVKRKVEEMMKNRPGQ